MLEERRIQGGIIEGGLGITSSGKQELNQEAMRRLVLCLKAVAYVSSTLFGDLIVCP